MKRLNKKGFTLIEMVVVIVIIAILAAILVPNLINYINNANEKKMISVASTIHKSIAAEIADMHKDNINVNGNQSSSVYDDEFWDNVSDKVESDVSAKDTSTYCVTFTVADNALTAMTVKYGDMTATMTSDGGWDISE